MKSAEASGGLPAGSSAFASTAQDLQALRDASVDAAGVGAGLWLSYLLVLLYLAIAAGGVTHQDFLLGSAVKLPFLSIDLPLTSFIWLGPVLLLVLHAYVLLHFTILADKLAMFQEELEKQIESDRTKAQLRRQLPSNIFMQIAVGPNEMRSGFKGILLRMIAWISLVIGPLAVLLLFLLRFLPYHDEAAAWEQRILITLDVLLLWKLWPRIAHAEIMPPRTRPSPMVIGTYAVSGLASIGVVVGAFGIATFPGESLYESPLFQPLIGIREQLVAGEIDFVTGKPTSLLSNRLVLPGIDVIDHAKFDTEAKIAALPATLSLRGRHLEGAVFVAARLRKADFSGAHLQGAAFLRADLRAARFDCDETPSKSCSDLRGASFYRAQLQGAYFDGAELQAADFSRAQLQGATFNGAQLQGVGLREAQLEEASFTNTQLQGAQFKGAHVTEALFLDAYVWRAEAPNPGKEPIRVIRPETQPKYKGLDCPAQKEQPPCDWSSHSFDTLTADIDRWVPAEQISAAKVRIAPLVLSRSGSSSTAVAQRSDLEKAWLALADKSSAEKADPADEEKLSKRLQRVGCDAPGAAYILRGVVHTLPDRFEKGSPQLLALAERFLDAKKCDGAMGLSERNRFDLQELVATHYKQ